MPRGVYREPLSGTIPVALEGSHPSRNSLHLSHRLAGTRDLLPPFLARWHGSSPTAHSADFVGCLPAPTHAVKRLWPSVPPGALTALPRLSPRRCKAWDNSLATGN